MAEDLTGTSDYDDDEMRQLFQDNSGDPKTIISVSPEYCENKTNSDRTDSVFSKVDSGKRKCLKKGNAKQRPTSGSGKQADGKSGSHRKGRQSKTPSASSQGVQFSGEKESTISPHQDQLPIFTSDIHTPESTFKLSLLNEVLTEKKMALMKSPEVVQFLKEHQSSLLQANRNNSDKIS